MAKKQDNKTLGIALIALVPWWMWLVVAVIAWFVSQAIIGTTPDPKATPVEAMRTALFKASGNFFALMGPLICILAALVSAIGRAKMRDRRHSPGSEADVIRQHSPDALDTSNWNLALLKALEWKRLEQLCAAYFRALKFRVEEANPGPDNGIDLKLYVDPVLTPSALVQCKAWNSWKVGVKAVRELFGVMASVGVSEGIFVTTSGFTDEAIQFARGNNISLIDGEDLLRKLRNLRTEEQEQLLRLATADDFTTPTCPSCGVKMLRRTTQSTGEAFWGCSRFPDCRSTIRIGRSG